MSGIWILLLLIIAAALPLIIVFFWFRKSRPQITLTWFLAAAAGGIISLAAAAIVQSFFSPPGNNEPGQLLFGVLVRVATVEEASRLLTLIPLIYAAIHLKKQETSFCAALGLLSGLGFAAVENAAYGMSDINVTLIRILTAALLHGACGIRTGAAVFFIRLNPVKAIYLFISAIVIHGAYNLIIISPEIPSLLAAAVALAALIASLHRFVLQPS